MFYPDKIPFHYEIANFVFLTVRKIANVNAFYLFKWSHDGDMIPARSRQVQTKCQQVLTKGKQVDRWALFDMYYGHMIHRPLLSTHQPQQPVNLSNTLGGRHIVHGIPILQQAPPVDLSICRPVNHYKESTHCPGSSHDATDSSCRPVDLSTTLWGQHIFYDLTMM